MEISAIFKFEYENRFFEIFLEKFLKKNSPIEFHCQLNKLAGNFLVNSLKEFKFVQNSYNFL